ncbi:lysine--tRNA ligase [Halovenus salina]|uniref:lysine--tRNA ligase n=1 Tax=Halovenus salina TaxID=1510225 RepID=UPI002260D428|nr:lysine--tRNA ligase [Halovenus salina]
MTTAERDPYEVLSDSDQAFWADAVADAIEARNPDEPIVIKGGVSPSGIPHIGHVNEILRAYYVAAVLRDRGHEVRQVFTADDRDRLRKLPRQLADLDGNIVGLGEVDAGALGRNLGRPYTDIPDPFGASDSYGDHFTELLRQSVDDLGIEVEFVSNTDLYEEGAFDDVIRHVLANQEQARDVLSAHQDKVDEEYVPFFAVCQDCGQLTETITGVDLDADVVSYTCTDIETGDDTIAGCGHEGTVSIREGKLPWRFEWPAQWKVLDVDFEPFGKDHAEGSWPSGVDVAENVLDVEPPVPMVYEWFTLDGEALSSSSGHVVTVGEVLDLLEPEVLRYFFVKEPLKQRDFSIEGIDQLVDEFDRFEATSFGEGEATDSERAFAERAYPFVVDEIQEERVRIPYTFAAVLGMTNDEALRKEIARKQGHIVDDTPEWAVNGALDRVERARAWARRTGNEFDYELKRGEMPDASFDEDTEAALDELADFVAEGHDGEAIQSEIYETAKRHDIDMGEFFAAGYRLFFDDDEGPQLGTFLGKLDREFVVDRLRRER